jgi:hypothetical protein
MPGTLPLNDLHTLVKSRKAKDGEPVALIEEGRVVGYFMPANWVVAQPQGTQDEKQLVSMLKGYLGSAADAD